MRGSVLSVPHHILRIDFHGNISQFVLGDGFQTLRAPGVGVVFDPSEGIKKDGRLASVFVPVIFASIISIGNNLVKSNLPP